MDQDEFNDFQQPAPPSQPQHMPSHPDIPQLSHHTQSVVQPTIEPQPAVRIQPSYSLDNNAPSQQANDYDSIDWEASAWPTLGKMESDHMAAFEHEAPVFSKGNSQKEAEQGSKHSPRQQVFNYEQKEHIQNYSNSATLHSNLYDDFDFGITTKIHHQPRSHSPDSLPEKNETTSPRKVEHEHSENHQKGQRHDLHRFGKKQEAEEDEFNDFGTGEARKQSEEFEYQEAVQPQQQFNLHELHKQVVQLQNEYHSEPDHNQPAQKICKDADEDFVEYQVSQPAQDFYNYEYKYEQPTEKHQEAPKEEEDDDEFGDFEQTVQTAEELHVNGISKPIQAQHSNEMVNPYQQQTTENNQVNIDPRKVPYDMNVPSRQQQLQKFVDSLPDYGFLLARAFNTL